MNGVDAMDKRVLLDDGGTVPYDTLILATGARHDYFGHDEWEPFKQCGNGGGVQVAACLVRLVLLGVLVAAGVGGP